MNAEGAMEASQFEALAPFAWLVRPTQPGWLCRVREVQVCGGVAACT